MALPVPCILSAHPSTSPSSLHWISNTVSKKAAILILMIAVVKHDSSDGSVNPSDTRYSAISLQHIRNQRPYGEKPRGEKQNKSHTEYHQIAIFRHFKFRTWVYNIFTLLARWLARFPSRILLQTKTYRGLNSFSYIHIF